MKVKNLLLLALLLIVAVACKYDDDALWNKVNSLDERVTSIEEKLTQMNSDINAMSVIVNALQNKVYVETVTETEKGYQIKFTDGKTVTIKNGENGQDGKDAPVISVDEFEGKYYWVQIIGETKTWLKDKNGDKLPVTGADAITPILKVNADGYWLISYDRGITFELLRDESGNPVKAVGKDGTNGTDGTNGVNGDSFFSDVKVENGELVLILKDGTELRIPMSTRGDGDVITVQGSVDINEVSGLSLITLLDEQQLSSTNFSTQTFSNNSPQYIMVTNENDDVIMMARNLYSTSQQIKIDVQSTAIALVTTNPLLAPIGKEHFEELVKLITSTSSFQSLCTEVSKSIENRQDILGIENTALLIALNNVIDEICNNAQNLQTRASFSNWELLNVNDPYPFLVEANGNTLQIRNTALAPFYDGTVTHFSLGSQELDIPTNDNYGGWGLIKQTWGDVAIGDPVVFKFTEEGEYKFHFTYATFNAQFDYFKNLTVNLILDFGLPLFEDKYIKEIADKLQAEIMVGVATNIDAIGYIKIANGIFIDYITTDAFISSQRGLKKKALKLLKKTVMPWTIIKGSSNALIRTAWKFKSPEPIKFCLCYYDNTISSCTETQLTKVERTDNQEGYSNQRLLDPIQVLVSSKAEDGTYIESSYQKVQFSVISDNGSVSERIVSTDESGFASTYWTLGNGNPGDKQQVRAVVIDMITGQEVSQPVYFTATLKEAADITIRLDWNKLSGRTDIDLHATDPYGEEIAYYHMNSASGGWLDRDDVIGPGPEHIYWQSAPDGNYLVQVHYYGSESQAITSYRVTINVGGQTFGPYTGSIGFDQLVTIGTIVMPDGTVTRSASKPTFIERREVQQSHKVYPRKN